MAKEDYVRALRPYFVGRVDNFWQYSSSVNLLYNGGFEAWSRGSSCVPDGWSLSGSGASIARSTDRLEGSYSVQLSNADGHWATFWQRAWQIGEGLVKRIRYLSFSCWVKCSVSGQVYVSFYGDVTGAQDKQYHPGDGEWHLLTSTLEVDPTETAYNVAIGIDTGPAVQVLADAACLVLGPVPAAYSPSPFPVEKQDFYPYGQTSCGLAEKLYFAAMGIPIEQIDDFDGSALRSGWAWAGSPFITPNYSLLRSFLKVNQFSGGDRAFLYRSDAMFFHCLLAKVSMTTNSTAWSVGLRYDDGTDDNFVEVLIRWQSHGKVWFVTRHRVGGGSVTDTQRFTLDATGAFVIGLCPQGTLWSNWRAQYQLRYRDAPNTAGLSTWISGLAWTPQRRGLVFTGDTSGWRFTCVDWFARVPECI